MEIHNSLQVMNSPGLQRPRPGMCTGSPYVRRRDSVSGYVPGDCACVTKMRIMYVPSNRPPVQNNSNLRSRDTDPGPVRSRYFVKNATYDGSGMIICPCLNQSVF